MKVLTKEAKEAMERAEIPCNVVIVPLPRKRRRYRGIKRLLALFSREDETPISISLVSLDGETILMHFEDFPTLPYDKITLSNMFTGLKVEDLGERE